MTQLNIAEAKAHFSEIIQKALLGEEIIIAKGHRPLVKIVPLSTTGNKRKPGSGTGQLQYMADDFDAPLDDFKEYM
ncbi:MAG: type II toxin-antitoxin system Phd/YefM family antitoxin [Thermodesulfobacteriota bacterium]|nr:type II toxin-antitoxin system Phd/YefM family antitoxin [Thermodesulfobacteriota bacterium]